MTRQEHLRFVAVFAIGTVCYAFISPAEGAQESEGLRVLQAASDAAASAVLSGVGEGVVKEYERSQPGSAWDLQTDANLHATFDHGKYRLEFKFSKDRLSTERQILIYDGTALFSTRFRKAISPLGAETEVFESRDIGGSVSPQLAGFHWDVSKLSGRLVNVSRVLKERPTEEIRLTLTPEGDYLGQCGSLQTTLVTFECPRKYAYNVGRTRVFGADPDRPAFDYVATWKQEGDVWYIDSFSEEAVLRGPGDRIREIRREMRYDKFTVNPKVSPDRFTMAALEAPAGSRILDHRPKRSEPVHYVPYGDKELEGKLGSMVEQLKSLPTETPRPPGVAPSWRRRALFWAMNAAIVLAIVGLSVALWRLRRKRSR